MKKEKQVRSYKRRTKSGKTIIVRAHTAKYDAADEKAKNTSKKEGAGKELEERKKKPTKLEIPFNKEEEKKVLDEVKDTAEKKAGKKSVEKNAESKVSSKTQSVKKSSGKKVTSSTTSSAPFTRDEFKEWYRGTGSAADKKVAKALRAQLGRAGYRKLEDEAIGNYSSRGYLSMFKKVSSGSSSQTTPKAVATDKSVKVNLKGKSPIHKWFRESPESFSKVKVGKDSAGIYRVSLSDGSGQIYSSKASADKDAKLLRALYKEWKKNPSQKSASKAVATKLKEPDSF